MGTAEDQWPEIVAALTTITGSFFVFKTKKRRQIQDTIEWLVSELRNETKEAHNRAEQAEKATIECRRESLHLKDLVDRLSVKVTILENSGL